MAQQTREVLVLGIGNVLWADEGFGVRAVEALNAAYEAGRRDADDARRIGDARLLTSVHSERQR